MILTPEVSQNAKTGKVSATWAPQHTCPSSCPLKDGDCYAEHGRPGMHTRRLNKAKFHGDVETANEEAQAIDNLTGRRDLRVHVVGDCKTDTAALIVSAAMTRHESKHGRSAWTYTHAWKPKEDNVSPKSWGHANVLASCDTLEEVSTAKSLGWATATVARENTPLFESLTAGRAITVDGHKLIPCPNETAKHRKAKPVTCIECRLCFDAPRLKRMNATIAFLQH